MQIQITIDTDKEPAEHVERVMRAIYGDPTEVVVTHVPNFTTSAPAASPEPNASAPQAPAQQAEANAAGAEPERKRGRPRKNIANDPNANPAAPIATTNQYPVAEQQPAVATAAASDAATSFGAAGAASPAPFVPPLGPSFNPDGTPASAAPAVEPPATSEGLLEQVFNKNGAAAAIACLQRFGVNRLRELKPEQMDEFSGYCRDVLAGRQDPTTGAAQ